MKEKKKVFHPVHGSSVLRGWRTISVGDIAGHILNGCKRVRGRIQRIKIDVYCKVHKKEMPF